MFLNGTDFSIERSADGLLGAFYNLESLVIAMSYVIGVTLIIRGIMMYRIFANQTYGSAQRGEIAGPLVFLVVGTVLIYFPSTISASVNTLFGTSQIAGFESLVSYQNVGPSVRLHLLQDVIISYVQLIGLIAFIRGWVILSKMGHSGSQPGSIGKGVIHIVGGVILINLIGTITVLANTLGFQI